MASTSMQAIKKRWKNVDLLLSDKGDPDTQDMEKSEVLNILFVSTSFLRDWRKAWNEDAPLVDKVQVR